MADQPELSESETSERCRYIPWLMLLSFILTFLISRLVVVMIMMHRLPEKFYFHVQGTHVHHLNYGIFILAGVGGYLLLQNPTLIGRRIAAVFFGIGLGLTFDEFGMWLHLGGGYWQRCSFDAVVVVAAILGLFATMPELKRFRPRQLLTSAMFVVILVGVSIGVWKTYHRAANWLGPRIHEWQSQNP